MKKKFLIIMICIIIAIVVLGIITNYLDSGRVTTNNEPRYCIKIISEDGSKVTYWGLGYKVIRYVGVSPNEPYQSNIGAKMGNWFMRYELPIDIDNNEDEIKNINNIDDFYNIKLTKDNDIRGLGKEYTTFDAQKDNCFVIGAMVHNDYLYNEFMEDYKDGKTTFIRVAQNTAEGDLILYDILYYEGTDKLYLVTDTTRDEFSSEDNRTIEFKQFENVSEYEYEDHLYWILYNGEISDDKFESNDIFIIATIN